MGISPGPTINWESHARCYIRILRRAAILVRYDINDETYRQRFRAASCKDGETYQELAVRTLDLLNKWMKDDPQKILEQIATEQLLGKMTREIQIYVRERKPESAGQEAPKRRDQSTREDGELDPMSILRILADGCIYPGERRITCNRHA